uniref:N37 n=1 Tax=synthetic construct TaxID=32630 RepID=UPI003CE5C9F5
MSVEVKVTQIDDETWKFKTTITKENGEKEEKESTITKEEVKESYESEEEYESTKERIRKKFEDLSEKEKYTLSNLVLAITKKLKELYEEYGAKEVKVTIEPINGKPLDKETKERIKESIEELLKEKGYDVKVELEGGSGGSHHHHHH